MLPPRFWPFSRRVLRDGVSRGFVLYILAPLLVPRLVYLRHFSFHSRGCLQVRSLLREVSRLGKVGLAEGTPMDEPLQRLLLLAAAQPAEEEARAVSMCVIAT